MTRPKSPQPIGKGSWGESYPLCVVTEGRGTIQGSYKGKTYWVCCSGCHDQFNDDPESVHAEAAAQEKAKAKK